MSNSRNTGFLTNVIKVDATGNVSFVSGSTTLATISTSGQMSGSLPALSSSYALSASYVTNAETLDGLDSTVFTLTSSFNTTSASLYTVSSSAYDTSGSLSATSGSLSAASGSLSATSGSLSATSGSLSAASGSLSATSGSLSATSGSLNTRVTDLEITGSALSSSILSVSASSYLTSGSLSSASGSFDTRISTVESKYATTGSNTFIGTQIISGSILQSGSFTSTGTLTAQTLVVQTITSSVVYSSGSNIFGNSIGNSQVFTGSVLITGSLTIAGGSSATSYSGTTIYGSTAVCSAVGKFTSCLDLGGALTGTSATFSGEVTITSGLLSISGGAGSPPTSGVGLRYVSNRLLIYGGSSDITFQKNSNSGPNLTILESGAATFSSTITGTTIYGSTAVCSPVGLFSGCVGVGISPQSILETFGASPIITITDSNTFSSGVSRTSGIEFKALNPSGNNTTQSAGIYGVITPETGYTPNAGYLTFYTRLQGCSYTEKMRITSAGNVGIGTTSPSATLHIVSPVVSAGTALKVVSDGNSNDKVFEFTGADGVASQSMYMFQSGNVGIGTSSPSHQLHVVNSVKFDTGLYFNNSAANGAFVWQIANESLRFGTCDTERMRITNGGNVLIGTQTASNSTLQIVCVPSSYNGMIETVGCSAGTVKHFRVHKPGYVEYGIGILDTNAFHISTASTFPTSNGFTMLSGGNIGFGETTPGTDRLVILGNNTHNNVWLRLKTAGCHGVKPAIHFDSGLNGTNYASKVIIMGGYSSPDSGGGGALVIYTNDTNETSQQRMCIDPRGAVTIMGALAKGSGSFRICHPLSSKVNTHALVHSFIEGPNADLIYSGHTKLIGGVSCINIDCISRMTEGTFEALNRCVRIFTTNESSWSAVKGKVCGNIVIIESQNNTSEDEISWMVIGERHDQHMFDTEWTDNEGRVITEPELVIVNDDDIVA